MSSWWWQGGGWWVLFLRLLITTRIQNIPLNHEEIPLMSRLGDCLGVFFLGWVAPCLGCCGCGCPCPCPCPCPVLVLVRSLSLSFLLLLLLLLLSLWLLLFPVRHECGCNCYWDPHSIRSFRSEPDVPGQEAKETRLEPDLARDLRTWWLPLRSNE